jgi:hypothetical protein
LIACEDNQLKELLETNASFKINFEKLLKAFEERMWTKETCALFKALCENLFAAYNIRIKVHVNEGMYGGRFRIEFLDQPFSEPEKP